MRVMMLNSDAPRFLESFYRTVPERQQASYAAQVAARADSLVGMADFYSRNFHALGHEAREVYVNNPWMLGAWAREHGMNVAPVVPQAGGAARSAIGARVRRALQPYRSWLLPVARQIGLSARLAQPAREILRAQIEDFAPDILLVQNIVLVDSDLLRSLRKPGRVIIGQHGVAPPTGIDYGVYDFAITLLPYVADHFRAAGLPAELVHLAFEPSVLERLPPPAEKDIELTFVGGIEAQYNDRIRMLEAICERYPVQLYLSGTAGLPASSPINKRQRGEVWGADMYRVLQRSQLTLNSHIDAVREFAGNMRLYEATGVGACLLTDAKSNLDTLFAPGREVATYTSVEDCLAQIGRLLENDGARQDIALQGQRRTLASHTYRQRVEQILSYVGRHGR
ncbi:MAG: glycosyltransferase [Rhizomicrobium sp.]